MAAHRLDSRKRPLESTPAPAATPNSRPAVHGHDRTDGGARAGAPADVSPILGGGRHQLADEPQPRRVARSLTRLVTEVDADRSPRDLAARPRVGPPTIALGQRASAPTTVAQQASDPPALAHAAPPSAMTHAPDRARSLRRVGGSLQTRTSLVVGGALVLAVLAGAGVVAWAASPVESQSVIVEPPQVQSRQLPANQIRPKAPAPAAGQSTAAAGIGGPDDTAGAAAGPVVNSAPPQAAAVEQSSPIPIDHGPATVSLLGPGDSGFGWPSTAFGSAPGNQ